MSIDGTRAGFEGVAAAAGRTEDAITQLTESMVTGGRQFELMLGAANSMVDGFASVGTAIQGITNGVPGLELLGGVIGYGSNAMDALAKSVTALMDTYYQGMGALDALSAGHRALYGDIYDVGTQFGKTFDEARRYGQNIKMVAASIIGADFGWLKEENLVETAKALAGNRVSLDRFGDSIISSAGKMDLLTAATLQAGASGLETADYFQTLSQAMIRQGLESQEAMEQLAGFKDTAEATGLSVKSISDALSNLGNTFSKIGLAADFGRPLVKSFGDTISDMGLGIENATELAATLSNSLGALATDYSTMYVTAQRGNLGSMMGGGALGAGIQFQAQLLEAEGDPQAQAKLGGEMATALRDTIASFAGGDITTVQEAASNPALEAQFYTQQRMLQQMYNLDDQTAIRTLDLLDRMGKATESGNSDLAQSLGEDLTDMITKNDETMDLQEKANAFLSGLLSEAMSTNEALFFIGRETLGEAALSEMNDGMRGGLDKLQEVMGEHRSAAEDSIKAARNGDNSLKDHISSIFGEAFGTSDDPKDGKENPLGGISKYDEMMSNIDAMIQDNILTNSAVRQFMSLVGGNTATVDASPSTGPGTAGAKAN
jgi:hypothetical protein